MKKNVFFLVLVSLVMFSFLSIMSLNAQVRIGGNNVPHSSTVLDLNTDNTSTGGRGIALPRVADTLRTTIPAPIAGLLVFSTSDRNLYVFDGIYWCQISGSCPAILPTTILSEVANYGSGGGFAKAKSACASMSNGPWRLPTKDELVWMYKNKSSHPEWGNFPNNNIWSSTPDPSNSGNNYVVNLTIGTCEFYSPDRIASIWCVK